MRPCHDWFWFSFSLVEKVARVLSTVTNQLPNFFRHSIENHSNIFLVIPLFPFLLFIVLSSCSSPGGIQHGRINAQNGSVQSGFPIWSTVTFECYTGYKLSGAPFSRQCLPSGMWTGVHNPTCESRKMLIHCIP